MPVIIPTPDELQRMSWHQRERALRRIRADWPRAEYAPAAEHGLREPWQDPEHPDWAEATRRKASEWLAALEPDPQAAHRLDLWTSSRRRSTLSRIDPQMPSGLLTGSCGQVRDAQLVGLDERGSRS